MRSIFDFMLNNPYVIKEQPKNTSYDIAPVYHDDSIPPLPSHRSVEIPPPDPEVARRNQSFGTIMIDNNSTVNENSLDMSKLAYTNPVINSSQSSEVKPIKYGEINQPIAQQPVFNNDNMYSLPNITNPTTTINLSLDNLITETTVKKFCDDYLIENNFNILAVIDMDNRFNDMNNIMPVVDRISKSVKVKAFIRDCASKTKTNIFDAGKVFKTNCLAYLSNLVTANLPNKNKK